MVSGQLSDSTGGEGEGSYMLPAIISLAQLLPNRWYTMEAWGLGNLDLTDNRVKKNLDSAKLLVFLAKYGNESA